jgi:FkbM family methyltransferase
MTAARQQALAATAKMLGLQVRALDPRSFLLQEPDAQRRVVRIGAPDLETDLLMSRRTARHRMPRVHQHLARFLLGDQVARLLQATGVTCVLDVGANAGQWAKKLRKAGYAGRIISFEPVSSTYARLSKAAADDKEWHVHNWALGSTNGTAEIHSGDRLSSMLVPSDFGRSWKSSMDRMETETIQVRRLESVFPEVTAGLGEVRVFLKMDTQGFDLEVVRGAGTALDRVVGLQSEVSCLPLYDGMPRLPEQLTTYEAAGFETVGIFPVTQHAATMRAIEMDLVMVRRGEVREPHG